MSSASPPPNRNLEGGRSTRDRVLTVATDLFAERGFANTSIDVVLECARVSKGSLYHHFASKQALFEAVLDAVEARVARDVVAAASGIEDPRQALRAACVGWLRLAADPVVRQVVLLDAPAAMGWEKWREIDERHAFGVLKATVEAIDSAQRLGSSPEVVAHVLLASIIEIAMVIARAEHPREALESGEAALDRLLTGMLGA
jgi:AcrR family transcriptional regulator